MDVPSHVAESAVYPVQGPTIASLFAAANVLVVACQRKSEGWGHYPPINMEPDVRGNGPGWSMFNF